MRRLLSHLALFLAMAGTAVAASPLLGSAGIKNETITSMDVRDGSVAAGVVARGQAGPRGRRGAPGRAGPRGPQGPSYGDADARAFNVAAAYVNADGTLRNPRGDVTASKPQVGVYCLTLPSYRWIDVTSTSVTAARRVSIGPPQAACGSAASAQVTVDFPSVAGLDDGPFLVVFQRTS